MYEHTILEVKTIYAKSGSVSQVLHQIWWIRWFQNLYFQDQQAAAMIRQTPSGY
jgi:hypothetical protein